MRNSILVGVRRVTNSPALNIFVGVILMLTGVVEVWDAVEAEMEGLSVGVHHGAVLFGAMHTLKYMAELFEGLEHIQRSAGGE